MIKNIEGLFNLDGMDKYFVRYENREYLVLYQGYCEIGGNYWAVAKCGFETEKDAQAHADRLNAEIV